MKKFASIRDFKEKSITYSKHIIGGNCTNVCTDTCQKMKVTVGFETNTIEVCTDCEFRYICTDCRAYREDPENLLSKPLKCGYNPYTCEWEEWSTNPLKQKAIDYYGMREMVSKQHNRYTTIFHT